jgi:hypothetical protein
VSRFEELKNIRNELNKDYTVNRFPTPVQEQIAGELPDLFDKKAFFKMSPRPNDHERSREYSYYKHCIQHVEVDGLWAEFGVYKGASSKYLNDLKNKIFPDSKYGFHGFDSFDGLPEAWSGTGSSKGKFKTGNVPDIPGVTFHKGWFKDTIPEFLESHKENFAFIHIDCDIYSSTVDILTNLKNRIVPGTVMLFDELIGYNAWKEHEYKAFMEFVEENDVEYEWIGYVANAGQAACKIKKIGVNYES